MRLAILISVLAGGLVAWQAPEGTAESCDNRHENAHKCACLRAMTECKMPGMKIDEPGAMCKTFCKPQHCHCAGPSCTSRH
jgi:hypothetical protein